MSESKRQSADRPEYSSRFKSCGKNVAIAPDIYVESPQQLAVGDEVTFKRGFYMMGRADHCSIGSRVTFYPNCFIQGSPGRFLVEEHVDFLPNTYISLGDGPHCFVEIGHHSHFAPGCVLYGWGGLRIGPYCNIAAHVVFATVGHNDQITDRPMALSGRKEGPITLEEDVWIGANVTITAPVRIARGCVIGANAVVTCDTQPMGVYVGVPARRLRDRGPRP